MKCITNWKQRKSDTKRFSSVRLIRFYLDEDGNIVEVFSEKKVGGSGSKGSRNLIKKLPDTIYF